MRKLLRNRKNIPSSFIIYLTSGILIRGGFLFKNVDKNYL
jgi:hypothetical protein